MRSLSCDFVVVDSRALAIRKVVEADGSFHARPGKRLRDWRKREILRAFGIDLEYR